MSEYTYTPTLVAQSNNSYIVKREIVVVDCDPTPAIGSCDLFNNTKCGNDECYAQPFISETIYLQWRFSMSMALAFPFSISLVDENFDAIAYTVPTTTYGRGIDSKYNNYQWILIDTSLIPANVDYFHVKVVYGDGSEEWFSEPFERVACDEETVLLSSVFNNGVDCFKNYHGDLTNYSGFGNIYQSQTRIWGTLEKVGNSVSKEIVEDVEISTTVEQTYLLRTSRKVPQYVADKITEIFSGKTLYIDGEIYLPGTGIEKDFDEGKSWIISTEVRQTCTTNNFKCS